MTMSRIIFVLTTTTAIYHLVLTGNVLAHLGIYVPTQIHNAISIAAALVLTFLLIPARSLHGAGTRRMIWADIGLICLALAGTGFVIVRFNDVLNYSMFGFLDNVGMGFALCLCVALLEAVRRSTGLAFPLIILTFVATTIFQPYLPGLLGGRGYEPERLLFGAYVGDAGIFGLPLRIAATIIIVFSIFGALMEKAGTTRWFMDLALGVAGWSRGGPAKTCILASAMFGSISGSPSANVSTTGAFTIPMMISTGYKPALAGAVEAVASTGGMILPPIMGSMAFIMAEWIEMPYAQVALAALVPALLYYLILFCSTHVHAMKLGLRPLSRSEMPRMLSVLKRGWHHFIPIITIIYSLLIAGQAPSTAGIYGALAVVGSSFLSRDRSYWLTPRRILEAFDTAVRRWIVIAAITAAVGIMISALELSGVGIKISRFVLAFSGGDLVLTLLLVGIVCFIVGMGLDATPAYITLATLMAPALVQLGVPEIAAHLYVIYWGLASFFTPPTCIAVFVAVGISGGRVWETGLEAVRLGIGAFIVPVAFVLENGLLLRGDTVHVAVAIVTALSGGLAVSVGTCGYSTGPLGPLARIGYVAGGLMLIGPGLVVPATGVAIIVAGELLNLALRRRVPKAESAE